MLQHIAGRDVFVVDFEEMPNLPVTGVGIEQHYAAALTEAIARGVVRKPGKYAIEMDWTTMHWDIFEVRD